MAFDILNCNLQVYLVTRMENVLPNGQFLLSISMFVLLFFKCIYTYIIRVFVSTWLMCSYLPEMVSTGTYALVITGRKLLGLYKGHPIYKVTSMKVLSCNKNLPAATIEEVLLYFLTPLLVIMLCIIM